MFMTYLQSNWWWMLPLFLGGVFLFYRLYVVASASIKNDFYEILIGWLIKDISKNSSLPKQNLYNQIKEALKQKKFSTPLDNIQKVQLAVSAFNELDTINLKLIIIRPDENTPGSMILTELQSQNITWDALPSEIRGALISNPGQEIRFDLIS